MNYSQKRTLVGRAVYIALTIMAVTVLAVTMYTFFGGSKRSEKPPVITDSATDKPVTDTPKPRDTEKTPGGEETEPTGNVTDDPTQVDVPPAKDWTKLKVMAPTEGTVYKRHDLDNAVFSLTMNDYRVHNGIDIECAAAADVVSCAYGTVKTAGYDPFMGYTVIIDHGDGLISCYRNLSG